MTFTDAVLLLFEFADKDDRRFQPAAARWHARFVLEANLSLGDSERVIALLSGVRGANRLVVRRRLLDQIQLTGLTTRDIS